MYTGVRFPLPEFTARVDGCQKMHLSSRAVNSARELGPWTRVVETDLNGSRLVVYYFIYDLFHDLLWNDNQ